VVAVLTWMWRTGSVSLCWVRRWLADRHPASPYDPAPPPTMAVSPHGGGAVADRWPTSWLVPTMSLGSPEAQLRYSCRPRPQTSQLSNSNTGSGGFSSGGSSSPPAGQLRRGAKAARQPKPAESSRTPPSALRFRGTQTRAHRSQPSPAATQPHGRRGAKAREPATTPTPQPRTRRPPNRPRRGQPRQRHRGSRDRWGTETGQSQPRTPQPKPLWQHRGPCGSTPQNVP